mmetsp:Transcript_7956/g.12776  ORF Transcript_7956/g.12776 Transcript_7956/m.12776 type:complete len:643 (+) Transcript_7956:215-2143(+)|eukprot:CAMPEP_0184671756 /NCGR_PEP_ID=MMETSP0308-20130426/85686_1 /TAXON_ID=38269 /ORGANISM="Gloeochaete witrockiana, Strain SAG 46.84" /LENGTH=642 /DNA_ID=CAMNT_0027118943 /DNA_START=214 /DNA_END=2142 /DNA_ORIENTATION=+
MNPVMEPASLYVGDLALDVTEAVLFDIFNSIGPVASIRVNRDALTRRSLGYAYVNFHNAADADRALEQLNFTPIMGRPCRIMWSHRDPSKRKTGVGNIYVKNLDKSIDNKALYDTFIAFGPILSCKVQMDESGNSRGFGFVHFETQEAADNAIVKVNGMLLNGRQVYVGPFVRKSQRSGSSDRFTNIFVKNLDPEFTDERLRELFEPFGDITSAVVMRNEDGTSRGFGFVNFDSADGAKVACDKLNGMEVEGRPLFVGRAQKKNERETELRAKFEQLRLERIQKTQANNVYIKNIDDSIDTDRLKQEFSSVGPITSATIMKDERGISKGFGFVCFVNADDAAKAVGETNGRMLGGKPLYVALAQRKEIRQQQLAAVLAQRAGVVQTNGFRNAPVPPPMAQMYGGQPPVPPGAPMYYQPMPAPYNNAGGPPQGGRGGPQMYVGYPPQVYTRGPPPQQRGPPGPPMPQQRGGAIPNSYPPLVTQGTVVQGGRVVPGGPLLRSPAASGPPPVGVMGGGGRGAPPQGQQQQRPVSAGSQRGPVGVMPQQQQQHVTNGGGGVMQQQGQVPVPMQQEQSSEDDKQLIGEQLFPMVQQMYPEAAGKITGMILELDKPSLLALLASPPLLEARVKEAALVLQAAQLSLEK